jgi:hypothetical protein
MGTLNTTVSGQRSDIDNNTASIGVLGATVAGHTTLISTNTTGITNNTSAIATTDIIVSGHTTAIYALEVPGFVATRPTFRWDFI